MFFLCPIVAERVMQETTLIAQHTNEMLLSLRFVCVLLNSHPNKCLDKCHFPQDNPCPVHCFSFTFMCVLITGTGSVCHCVCISLCVYVYVIGEIEHTCLLL